MKENKIKGGNKDALQSGRDKYTVKKYINLNLSFHHFSSVLLTGFLKLCIIINHEIRPE